MLSKEIKLSTALFGALTVVPEEGMYQRFELNIKNRVMNVSLFIHERALNGENKAEIERFLNEIPNLYDKIKAATFEEKDSSPIIRYYLDEELEIIENLHEIFEVASNDEITDEMLINQLKIAGIGVYIDEKGDLNLNIDLTVERSYSDELLVFYFNEQLDISLITHES